VLWHLWLGVRKSIRPVQIEWWDTGCMVIWLERGANDLHTDQLMPLPPNEMIRSASSLVSLKSRMVLRFWCRLTQVFLERRPLEGYLSICQTICESVVTRTITNRGRLVSVRKISTEYKSCKLTIWLWSRVHSVEGIFPIMCWYAVKKLLTQAYLR